METVHHRRHPETGEADSAHLRVGSRTSRFLSRVSSASCDGSFTSSQTWRDTLLCSFSAGMNQLRLKEKRLNGEQPGRSIAMPRAVGLARQQSAMKAWLQAEAKCPASNEHRTDAHVLFNTGPLELVCATGEPTFRVWILCPRFGRDLPHF